MPFYKMLIDRIRWGRTRKYLALGHEASSLRVAVPSPARTPAKVKRRRGNVYANLTPIVFRHVTLLQENI